MAVPKRLPVAAPPVAGWEPAAPVAAAFVPKSVVAAGLLSVVTAALAGAALAVPD